ncbi:ras-related protein Rab-37 isoform X2 [Megachile rotundata]|uniref:ras-related protein Rab-37 isoform X2 n=1 Tax=Megachile rotundata TaxID=143995 RepID=UPI000614B302|nr:PREDICTED: ras-related protein Rab-37 isoform X2 [Megachile rotundata]
MSSVEEKLRGVTKRGSRHGQRGTGTTASDWSTGARSSGGARGPAPTAPSQAQTTGSAFNKPQESMGPTRRQSSRDSFDSTGQQAPPEHGELLFKVMLLGDSGVGKTCLLTRFRDGRFLSGNYITTVGIDFRNKVVVVDDTSIKLQIWDTAGQERFRSVTHAYYRDAQALLLLYDVTNKTSYDNIRAWLSEIREHAKEDVVIMLLGNKSDCGTERVVKREDGERLAQEYKVPFMETSAKTGLNVELAFLAVARELKARKSSDPDDTKFNVQDYVRQQSQRNSCFNSNCLTT